MINPYFLGEADNLGQDVHLFLDDFAIEDRWDAERVQNVAIKHPTNPVMVADLPWEKFVFSPVVMYDEELHRFRMWYAQSNMGAYNQHGYGPYFMVYAESDDGISWHKPLSDRYSYGDYKETNIGLVRGICG